MAKHDYARKTEKQGEKKKNSENGYPMKIRNYQKKHVTTKNG